MPDALREIKERSAKSMNDRMNVALDSLCRRAAADHRAGAGGARRRDRRAGARRSRLSAGPCARFRLRRLHGSDHGRAAGRHHGHRGLRSRLARAFAGARCQRPDRRRLSAGNLFARHRPAAGAALRFRSLCRPRRTYRDAGADRRPQALPRRTPRHTRRGRTASLRRAGRGRNSGNFAADRRHDGSKACSHRRADFGSAAAKQARRASSKNALPEATPAAGSKTSNTDR